MLEVGGLVKELQLPLKYPIFTFNIKNQMHAPNVSLIVFAWKYISMQSFASAHLALFVYVCPSWSLNSSKTYVEENSLVYHETKDNLLENKRC